MCRYLAGAALLAFIGIFNSSALADDLTLHFISAPKRIDWSRPDRVFVSTFWNFLSREPEEMPPPGTVEAQGGLANHAISHVDVRVRCAGEPDHWSGMTSRNANAGLDQVLGNGGFEILLTSRPGRLYTAEEIQAELPRYQESGRLAFFEIGIRPETCKRLLSYAREYVERGYDRVFGGLQHRPRYGEGSGCAAYAASFLEIAGLVTPDISREWRRKILIPLDLIGTGSRPARLGFFDYLFLGWTAEWASPQEPHLALEFWDPQLMYDWVRRTWVHRPADAHYDYLQIKRSLGLRIDRTDVPAPDEPFWHAGSRLMRHSG